MDSALRPREIQARIRAGESLEEVARLSGASADRIERFATPVLAEREYVTGVALTSSVRRWGELSGHRNLGVVAGERFLAHGIDPETVSWDSWRNEDKRWTVLARWSADGEERTAKFLFDLNSRFTVADDEAARWLLAEDSEAAENDELALVRVVGGTDSAEAAEETAPSPAELRHVDEEPTITLEDVPGRLLSPSGFDTAGDHTGRTSDVVEEDPEDWLPRSAATPLEIREELEAEIDAYGVVPEGRSELDVLYDMLGGIAEDSINIYAGLTEPILPDARIPEPEVIEASPTEIASPSAPPAVPEPAAPTDVPDSPVANVQSTGTPEAAQTPAPRTQAARDTDATQTRAAKGIDPTQTQAARDVDATETQGTTVSDQAGALQPSPAEPSLDQAEPSKNQTEPTGTRAPSRDKIHPQPSLVDDEPTIAVAPGAAKRRGARKKRASVPSWDEIMFGGPKPE